MIRRTWVLLLAALVLPSCVEITERSDERSASARSQKPDPWRVIAEGPIKSDYGHRAVWTGDEMIVWGGTRLSRDSLESHYVRTGGAYDPRTDTWRKVPPAPVPGGSGYSLVWTGDEMIVWGGSLTSYNREHYDGEGAAYDSSTDSWRKLPRAPLPAGYDAIGAWTGREVLVMATPMGIDSEDYPKFAELAAYDPESDSWRSLERPPQVAYVSPPVAYLDGMLNVLSLGGTVNGGEVNGYEKEYETGGIYDYENDQWSAHSEPPERPNQTWEQTAMREEIVIDGLAYRPSTDTWRTLPDFPLREREFPVVVWTGKELIVWGGAKEPRGNVIVDPPPPLHDGAAYTPAEMRPS